MKKIVLSFVLLLVALVAKADVKDQLRCPENSVFGFTYTPGYTGPNSADLGRDDGYSTRTYCSFVGNCYRVGGVRFYGYFLNFSDWTSDNSRLALDANGEPTQFIEFEVKLYEMSPDGAPGTEVRSITRRILGKKTGYDSAYGMVFTFDVDLATTDSIDLEDGWISVAAVADGMHHDATFAMMGHAGVVNSQCAILINGNQWMQSSSPAAFCLLGNGTLIPGCDPPDPDPEDDPDDPDGLPIPQPLEPTNITEDGFTANWKKPTRYMECNGYELWTYATRPDAEEGDEFHFANANFVDEVHGGTLDDPTLGDDVMTNVSYFHRPNWTAVQVVLAEGAFGVSNALYGTMNGSIMSPIYDLSNADGKVKVGMTVCGRNVTKVNVIMFHTGSMQEISSKSITVTNDWQYQEVELTGGDESSYILIEVDQNSPGLFYLQDLDVYQELHEGQQPFVLYNYAYTLDRSQTSMYVETASPLSKGELLCYMMTSFKDEDRSKYSDYVYVVEPEPEPVEPAEPDVPANPEDGRWTDLGDPANCYIVTKQGYYEFTPDHVDGTSVEGLKTVNWLWAEKQSNSDDAQKSIAQVRYDENAGKVRFYAAGNTGNAVLAGFDAQGNIIWTWHIWMPKNEPRAMKYDSANKIYFMDRFLGALSGDSIDGDQTYGLMYQWGRPAPFFGAKGQYNEAYAYALAYEWTAVNPVLVNVIAGGEVPNWKFQSGLLVDNLNEAIGMPMTHISGTKTETDDYTGYWWKGDLGTGVALWDTSAKTNYDPSPAGWRLPKREEYPTYFTVNAHNTVTSEGFSYLTEDGQKDWYPACGSRSYDDARLAGVKTHVFFWEGNFIDFSGIMYPYRYTYTIASKMGGHGAGHRAFAQCVRLILNEERAAAINVVEMKSDKQGTGEYNLAGQKVGDDYKGIVIMNGKKYLKK